MEYKTVISHAAVVGSAGITPELAGYIATICFPTPEGDVDVHVTREQLENIVATGLNVLRGVEEAPTA